MRTSFQKGYTDVCVFVGRSIREAAQDYDALRAFRPEELLGYRVELTTPDLAPTRTRGLVVAKVIFTVRAAHSPFFLEAIQALRVGGYAFPLPQKAFWFDARGFIAPIQEF